MSDRRAIAYSGEVTNLADEDQLRRDKARIPLSRDQYH